MIHEHTRNGTKQRPRISSVLLRVVSGDFVDHFFSRVPLSCVSI